MKRFLSIILTFLFLASVPCEAKRHPDNEKRHERCENHGKRHHRPSYYIGSDVVLYDGQAVKGASPSSFRVLKDGYALDTWAVYYRGRKIRGASSDSFSVVGNATPRTHGAYIIKVKKSKEPLPTVSQSCATDMQGIPGLSITTASKSREQTPIHSAVAATDMPRTHGTPITVAGK